MSRQILALIFSFFGLFAVVTRAQIVDGEIDDFIDAEIRWLRKQEAGGDG